MFKKVFNLRKNSGVTLENFTVILEKNFEQFTKIS